MNNKIVDLDAARRERGAPFVVVSDEHIERPTPAQYSAIASAVARGAECAALDLYFAWHRAVWL